LIKIGDYNKLNVIRQKDFGYFLGAEDSGVPVDILLPNKSAGGRDLNIGDEVEAFIYRDSSDRLVATFEKPIAKVGDFAYLKVVSNTKIGSFVDFGLERDILVPLKEKLYGLLEGNYYLFYIYLDKTDRIAATTNVDKYLETTDKYNIGDAVKGTVYGFQTNGSAMVAVEDLYRGVILNTQYFTKLYHGDRLELTINKIYEDGKLGLTPRKAPKAERESLQETILEYLKAHNGSMPYNDKSSAEEIHSAFKSSKNYFKNALGGLMKRGLIVQDEKGTHLK
jgi:uncharacterized protein